MIVLAAAALNSLWTFPSMLYLSKTTVYRKESDLFTAEPRSQAVPSVAHAGESRYRRAVCLKLKASRRAPARLVQGLGHASAMCAGYPASARSNIRLLSSVQGAS